MSSNGKDGVEMELTPMDEDYEERMIAFESTCADGTGNPVSCQQLGEFLSVVKGDHVGAYNVFKKNCEDLKHPPSCFNLGRYLVTGKAGERSEPESAKKFALACNSGHNPACYFAGVMFLHGAEDVEPDVKKAEKFLETSCDGGLADGCRTLAVQYLRTDGEGPLPRSPARAETLLEKGCKMLNGPCCFNLAVMYKHGDEGVPRDKEKHKIYAQKVEELVKQQGGSIEMTKRA